MFLHKPRHRIAFGDQFVYDAFDGTPVLVLELWDEDYKVKVELGNKKAQLGADDYIGRCFVPLQTLVEILKIVVGKSLQPCPTRADACQQRVVNQPVHQHGGVPFTQGCYGGDIGLKSTGE